MKKGVFTILGILICFGLAACTGQQAVPPVSEQSSRSEQPGIQNNAEASESPSTDSQEPASPSSNTEMQKQPETEKRKVKLTIDGQEFEAVLHDTPAADALYDMLPLSLTFEDFNGTEKIAYLDDELPTEGEPEEFDPDVGDLCLYAPWGNLSIFYKDFRNSNGLISLGHIDSGIEAIVERNGSFSAALEKAENKYLP